MDIDKWIERWLRFALPASVLIMLFGFALIVTLITSCIHL